MGCPGRPRLDCLGFRDLAAKTEEYQLLDCLGFPWILSSEMSLFRGLRGEFRGNKIRAPSSLGQRKLCNGNVRSGHAKGRICSCEESVTMFRIFRNELSARAEIRHGRA